MNRKQPSARMCMSIKAELRAYGDALLDFAASCGERMGYEFVGIDGLGNYRVRHKTCGSIRKIAIGFGMHGACETCFEAREQSSLAAQLVAIGWVPEKKINNSWWEFRHLVCGHVERAATQSQRGLRLVCSYCKAQKLGRELELIGWDLVKINANGACRMRCLTCNVVITKDIDGIPNNQKLVCQNCDEIERISLMVTRKGWEPVRPVRNGYWELRCLTCGKLRKFHKNEFIGITMRCPGCNPLAVSALHQSIREWLAGLKRVEVEAEYLLGKLPGVGVRSVRCDFRIAKDKIKILLEIDGKQHYVGPFGRQGFDSFARQIVRDKWVEQEAVRRGFILLRFGSWEPVMDVINTIDNVLAGISHEARCIPEGALRFAGVAVPSCFWEIRAKVNI